MSSNFQFTGTPVTVTGDSYDPKLYVYLPDYKPQTEIDTFITNEVDVNGKFWGVFWENYRFNSGGTTLFIDDTEAGASNLGFTAANKTRVQNIADNVLITMAGDVSGATGAGAMLASSSLRSAAIDDIVGHVQTEGFQGVNINFEPIASITGAVLTNFESFVTELRSDLDAVDPNLILTWAGQIAWDSDIPGKEYTGVNYTGESNMAGTNNFSFTVNDLKNMGFDIVEMQAYDQFYDFGEATLGITSYDQVSDSIDFALDRLDRENFGMIIGTYGVRMNDGGDVYGVGLDANNMTRADVIATDATYYTTATRQNGGYLQKDVTGSKQILAPDQRTIDTLYAICKNKRVEYIGFWLAGDNYFPTTR